MKKNSFRLQTFLRIKEFEEKNAWSEVLRQEAQVHLIVQEISNLKNQQKIARKNSSTVGLVNGAQLYELNLAHESIIGTDVKIEHLKVEQAREEKILDKLRAKHIESKKELKTIEKLKEKNSLEFKVARDKYEAKQTNEIAQQMHLRGKAENE